MIQQVEIGDLYVPLLDWSLREPFVLFEGPRGTGKTRAILTALMCRALSMPKSRWLIARSTRTRLTDTVLATLEEQVFPAFGIPVPGGAGRNNRHDYVLPNGSVFLAQGLDDPQRTQSAEFAGMYVAEAVELPLIEQVTALAGSMRQHVPGLPFHQCIVDCNPGPPAHWLNQTAEEVPKNWRRVTEPAHWHRLLEHAKRPAPAGRWKRVITRHADNPHFFDVRRWEWTAAGRAYLETLGYLTGHLKRRWLDGEWVSAEGTVFPEFDEDKHVCPPFKIPDHWPIYVGWDPGYDHPTAILWLAISDNETVYVFDEIYEGGKSVAEHCKAVHARNAERTVLRYYGDPQHAFSKTAQSPKSIASQAKECGIAMSQWPRSTDKEAMVNRVRQRLIDGKLKVLSTCRNTIAEFQTWAYKRTAKGELPPGDDAYEDANNHAMDVICGLCSAGLKHARGGVTVVEG